MYKPKYFTPSELMYSAIANAKHRANVPFDWDYIENLTILCEKILDPARELLACPIYVSSGYRTTWLNSRVKGAVNSYHIRGCAVDIYPKDDDKFDELYNILKYLNPTELIKYDTFIHVAYEKDN